MLLNTAFADMGDIRPRVDPKATDFLHTALMSYCARVSFNQSYRFRNEIRKNGRHLNDRATLYSNVTWLHSSALTLSGDPSLSRSFALSLSI